MDCLACEVGSTLNKAIPRGPAGLSKWRGPLPVSSSEGMVSVNVSTPRISRWGRARKLGSTYKVMDFIFLQTMGYKEREGPTRYRLMVLAKSCYRVWSLGSESI